MSENVSFLEHMIMHSKFAKSANLTPAFFFVKISCAILKNAGFHADSKSIEMN
jgi:hypothetical protein